MDKKLYKLYYMEEETKKVYFIYIIFKKNPSYKHIFYLLEFNPDSFYMNDNQFKFIEEYEYSTNQQLISKKHYWNLYYNPS